MIWKRMNNTEAKKIVDDIEKKSSEEFNLLKSDWTKNSFSNNIDREYQDIRNIVYAEYKKYEAQGDDEVDYRVGLALYKLFLQEKYKLNPIYANDDDIWRYLSVRIFLDITYLRSPTKDRFGVYFSHDRIYKHTKRIWIKQLWWFIHLTWQGDEEQTYAVLKKYGPGCFSQILERAGKGYRVEIIRKMFKKMAERNDGKVNQTKIFTPIMKLYYAKMFVVEPTLVDGGIDSFLDKILDEKLPRRNTDETI